MEVSLVKQKKGSDLLIYLYIHVFLENVIEHSCTCKFLDLLTIFFPANDDLKALFARSKEGNIRTIKVDIRNGML